MVTMLVCCWCCMLKTSATRCFQNVKNSPLFPLVRPVGAKAMGMSSYHVPGDERLKR